MDLIFSLLLSCFFLAGCYYYQLSQKQQQQQLKCLGTFDLVSGGVVGMAIGDAVGFVVEGNPPDAVSLLAHSLSEWERERKGEEEKKREVLGLEETKERDRRKLPVQLRSSYFPFGQYSDDTQLLRELLLASIGVMERKEKGLREEEGWGEEIARSFANRIAELYQNGRIVGCGLATSKAIAELLKGKNYKESGCKEGMAGNSPAVRGVGVGLTLGALKRKTQLFEVAVEQCIVTHTDPLCKAGSVAMAAAIDYLLANRHAFNPSHFIDEVVKEAERVSDVMASSLRKVPIFLQKRQKIQTTAKQIMDLIPNCGKKSIFSAEKMEGISGHILPSIVWAFFCFLSHPYNFMSVLVACLKGGGDTDSTCALACSLSGTFLGFASLPLALRRLVRDGEERGEEELREICWRVCALRRFLGEEGIRT